MVLKASYNVLCLLSVYAGSLRLHLYLHGPAPYALVTGATDGIGKATASELYLRGFNLILHGRNERKLQSVREELQTLRAAKKDIRFWVVDANRHDIDFEEAVKQWDGLDITLVVHNVGTAPLRDLTYAVFSSLLDRK